MFDAADAPKEAAGARDRRPLDLSDGELIAKAKAASNGAKFSRLWDGNLTDYNGDDSRADQALCNMLAFWTNRDRNRIDQLFRSSGLYRGKWDRADYRKLTIDKALTTVREGYTPGPRIRAAGNGHAKDDHAAPVTPPADAGEAWEPPPAFDFIDSRTFIRRDCRPTWLIRRLVVKGQPCIMGGPQKTLKTSIEIDMGVSMGTGCKALGHFDPGGRFRVGILSGESGEAALQNTFQRVCAARGVDPAEAWVFWGFRLPSLADPVQLAQLADRVRAYRLDVIMFDPLYLGLLSGVKGGEFDAKSLYDVGPLLMRFSDTMLAAGATPLLCHHFKQTRADQFAEPDLGDLNYAGVREFARQWVLLGRRSRYEHTGRHALYLVAGGSMGHSYAYALDVNEGVMDEDFGGRVWETTVAPAGDVRRHDRDEKEEAKRQARWEKDDQDDAAVIRVLRENDRARLGMATSKVRDLARLNTARMARAVDRLTRAARVCRTEVTIRSGRGHKSESKVEGIRLTTTEVSD
jgi:hypothetical protein